MQSMQIPTKILILSDTHADELLRPSDFIPQTPFDVVIHCGDLTDGSRLDEYRIILALLASIDAPLKLVIPGNHDFTLDDRAFEKIRAESPRLSTNNLDDESIDQSYGRVGQARETLAAESGISLLLEQGIYNFNLLNGAKLTVFASPFTPSKSNSNWGFQYHPDEGHDWTDMNSVPNVDVVITHGPPQGVFDRVDGQRVGCPHLFSAVARARPRLHCFGHIHQGWGARHVAWRDEQASDCGDLNHYTCIDNNRSHTVESLSTLKPGRFDSAEDVLAKNNKEETYRVSRAVEFNLGHEGNESESSNQTLYVNAAIQGIEEGTFQLPWVVCMDLDKAG